VVLTYPYPDNPNVDAMIWQAESGMHFRLIGGYALVAGADRVASYNAIPGYQPSVPATLVADFLGTTPSSVHPGAERATPGQVRAFLSHYGVGTVLAQPSGAHPGAAYALLRAALGTGPQRRGGVDAWFGVQRDLRRTTTSSNST